MMVMRPPGPLLEGLREFVQMCPDGGTVVEVGSYRGESAREWMKRVGRLWCVDPWAPFCDKSNRVPSEVAEMVEVEAEFDAVLAEFDGRIVKVKSRSLDAVSRFAVQSVDVVYLDGLHDFESLRGDILAWRDVPKVGGLLAVHDFGHPGFPGVARAVEVCLHGPDGVFQDGTAWKRRRLDGSVQSARPGSPNWLPY